MPSAVSPPAPAPASKTQPDPSATAGTVETKLHYVIQALHGQNLWSVEGNTKSGRVPTNAEFEPYDVTIDDIRGKESEFNLDKHGFQCTQNKVPPELLEAIRNQDNDTITEKYYPLLEEFIKKVTGATHARAFNHAVRCASKDWSSKQHREPVRDVHADMTLDSGHNYFPELFDQDVVDNSKSLQILNMWHPLKGPLTQWPIALSDAKTVGDDDAVKLIPKNEIYGAEIIHPWAVYVHNPGHKWYYWSNQMPEEVLLFKQWDSKLDVARVSPHASFKHPGAEGQFERESFDLRMALVY